MNNFVQIVNRLSWMPISLVDITVSFVERLELSLAVDAWHREVAVIVLRDEASLHELGQQVHRRIALTLVLLHHLDLGLQRIVLAELRSGSLSFLFLGRFISLDLLLGALAAGAGLEHVRRDTLARCHETVKVRR